MLAPSESMLHMTKYSVHVKNLFLKRSSFDKFSSDSTHPKHYGEQRAQPKTLPGITLRGPA